VQPPGGSQCEPPGTYVRLADEIAGYRTATTTLAVVGLLVVAIGMAGLANALTMSVLERTHEIGILRSIGARARDIRRIFAAETLALAAAGWLIGPRDAQAPLLGKIGKRRASSTQRPKLPEKISPTGQMKRMVTSAAARTSYR